jgi:hypothetical protein
MNLDNLLKLLRGWCRNQRLALNSFLSVVLSVCFLLSSSSIVTAQGALDGVAAQTTTGRFRIGEKLTYGLAFGKFTNAGYAELSVVSGGKLSGRDAVELRSKIKTLEMVSAAFFQIDENRVVYVAPDTGMPIYIVNTDNSGPLPRVAVIDYLAQPASHLDLISLIYKVRESNGNGTLSFMEKDQVFTAALTPLERPENVRTEAGFFDTTAIMVQSEFLTAQGISNFKINLSVDEFHVPVLVRFRTPKGEFRISLTSIGLPEAVVTPPVMVPITPTSTPIVVKPVPTPDASLDNRPLSPELGFQLGESLDYHVTSNGIPAGVITLSAKERRSFQNADSMLLTATVTRVYPGAQALRLGDGARVQVDPNTLAPQWLETKFATALPGFNQTVTFDTKNGGFSIAGDKPGDGPIGTHNIISLIYAMRSFHLKPSKDPANPVNDTRVAVFWESRPYIFTLRPSMPEDITINGEKVTAQLININTGNPQLDAFAPKVWLATDSRVPLRFTAGSYQADLLTQVIKP